MDAALKNTREWAGLLFGLFLAFDLAGVQYRMQLRDSASLEPDLLMGRIAELAEGCPDACYSVYVKPGELMTLHGLLGAALVALLATLALIVGHGIVLLRRQRNTKSQ